jgi:S-adenosylmethionine synthetase
MTIRTEVAEFILPGHPDKLCDAVVDSIVQFVRERDPLGQCGLEAACVFDQIFLTGRIASYEHVLAELDVDWIVRETYASAGYGLDESGYKWGPLPEDLKITTAFCWGAFEEGERDLRHLSDDQAICIGYANHLSDTDHLPPAHWLARQIGKELHRLRPLKGSGQIGPDAKVIVRIETDGTSWQPKHVSISLNHHVGSDWLLLHRFAEEAVSLACKGKQLPTIDLNGAGMFVSGGPNGDNGLSGKKLVVDAYGPTVPIGGGAWSGKDLNKVDRLGGYLAREIALQSLNETGAQNSLVTLEYIPGCEAPVRIDVLIDGEPCKDLICVSTTASLGNKDVSTRLNKELPSLTQLSRWGHHSEVGVKNIMTYPIQNIKQQLLTT